MNSAHSPLASSMPWRTRVAFAAIARILQHARRRPCSRHLGGAVAGAVIHHHDLGEIPLRALPDTPAPFASVAGSRFSSLYAGMIMEMERRKRSLIIAYFPLIGACICPWKTSC